jgi:DNA-binding response OmpR family regulator
MYDPIDILVVDNDLPIVDLISEVLVDEGYRVRVTTNSTEVLALVDMQRPALLLIDLHMPNMNGLEVINQLHSSGYADIPVVLVTASSERSADMAKLDGREYLLKPFDLNELLACVMRYARLPNTAPQQHQLDGHASQRPDEAANNKLALAPSHSTTPLARASSGRYWLARRARTHRQASRRGPQWLWAWRSTASSRHSMRRLLRTVPLHLASATPVSLAQRASSSVPIQRDSTSLAERARLRAQTAELIRALAQQCERASAAHQHAAQLLRASAQARQQAAELQARVAQHSNAH